MGRILAVSSISMAMFMSARPASACSPPPDLALWASVVDGSREVPTDGVVAFRATAYGEFQQALGLLAVEVVDGDDAVVPGAIETIEISSSDTFGETREIFVGDRSPERRSTPARGGAPTLAR